MYMERFRLDDRVAVVTGGAQAIGLACAGALAEAGAKVYILDRNAAAAEQGLETLKANGYTARFRADVVNSAEVDAAAARVLEQEGRVDVLVCCAGVARSDTRAEDLTNEYWLNTIDVNLNGLFWCCRAFGKPMLAARRGSIVNIGSMSASSSTSRSRRRSTTPRKRPCTISRSRSRSSRRRAASASTPWRRPTSTPRS